MGTAGVQWRGGRRAVRAALAATMVLALGSAVAPGCSLGNVGQTDCDSSAQCEAAFGIGSACNEGFCGEPTVCSTGHDCRRAHGGGACVAGRCVDQLPAPPSGCNDFDPEIVGRRLIGPDAPRLVGGMMLTGASFSPPIERAVELGAIEINKAGGLGGTQPLGLITCDNGGADNALAGDERTARIHEVLDYLAGTLGVPFIVGPLTSGDSQTAIQHVIAMGYPTVLISPSATSPGLTSEPDRIEADEPFGLFWRTAPSDELQGKVLATAVAGTYPTPAAIGKVFAAYRDDSYGLGLATSFQTEFPGETVLQKFTVGADLSPVAASAASELPDAVLFIDIDPAPATEFMAAMANQPLLADKPLYFGDGSRNADLLDQTLPADVQDIVYNDVVGTVPATPAGTAFDLFAANYQSEFGSDPSLDAFTANGYDAMYCAAAALEWAQQNGNAYDGRDVAVGLSRLVSGQSVEVGQLTWPEIRNELTTGDRQINIVGISGPLDFDVDTGQPDGAIEVWRPSNTPAQCPDGAPCFVSLETIQPD